MTNEEELEVDKEEHEVHGGFGGESSFYKPGEALGNMVNKTKRVRRRRKGRGGRR